MGHDNHTLTCPHRTVANDGRIVCDMITLGDNEVNPVLCRECPAQKTSCQHLKFSLQKLTWNPIRVRYASGRVEVLDDHPPRIAFLRAACSEKVVPVSSPRECAGCLLHSTRRQPAAVMRVERATRTEKVIPFPRHLVAAS